MNLFRRTPVMTCHDQVRGCTFQPNLSKSVKRRAFKLRICGSAFHAINDELLMIWLFDNMITSYFSDPINCNCIHLYVMTLS